MIQFFRNLFTSKLGAIIAILFVVLIFFAFALADINAPGGMFSSSNAIASVDGEEISEDQVSDLMNRQLQQIRESNPGVDMNMIVEQGALDDAIEFLARGLAMRRFAEEHGLVLSKALIDAQIANEPAFRGLTGEFDEQTFRQILAAQNLSEADVREQMQMQLIDRIMLGPVRQGFVAEALARPVARLFFEQRQGRIAAVPSAAMPEGDPPTNEQLARYYRANIDRYTLPERRAIRYATFSRSQIPVPDPTEEQIRAYYREHADEYAGTETRSLSQVILPSQDAARAFYRAVSGGTDFTAAAAERGFSAGSTQVDGVTREIFARQTNDAVAGAAFSGDEGALLQPVRSDLGWHVIRIRDITQRNATPLSAVRPEITQNLREELGQSALAGFYLEIESAIENGASFDEVVEDKDLTAEQTPLVTPAGLSPTRPDYRPNPDVRAVVQQAFQMDEDEDAQLVELEPEERFALVDVTQVARTAPQPLARIRQTVEAQYVRERANRQARRIADGIREKVNDGTSLDAAVADAGVSLPPPERIGMSRAQLLRMGANMPAPLELLFQMAVDTAKLVQLPNQEGWFVVVLEEIQGSDEEIPGELLQQTRDQFAEITGNEYAQQFVNAIVAEYPLERNEEAIEALGARLTGTGS